MVLLLTLRYGKPAVVFLKIIPSMKVKPMSDYPYVPVYEYVSGQDYLRSLTTTSDHDLISAVVAGDDEVAKAYVVDNPRLSNAQMMTLANDDDIVVRQELAKASHLSPDVLDRLRTDTAGIRTSIAMVTEDSDLLNKIYFGTKSKEIRYWVECNPMFLPK